MRIKVTKKHIVKGTVENALSCPIALALKEIFDEDVFVQIVEVDPKFARCAFALADAANNSIPLPDKCMQFMLDFDREKPVKPFTFELPLS